MRRRKDLPGVTPPCRVGDASGVEEYRLLLALQPHVKAVEGGAGRVFAGRDQGVAASGLDRVQHRILGVGLGLVREIYAGVGVARHAAGEDDDGEVRRLRPRVGADHAPGLYGLEAVLALVVRAGAAEAVEVGRAPVRR